jgi:hypothetical protein
MAWAYGRKSSDNNSSGRRSDGVDVGFGYRNAALEGILPVFVNKSFHSVHFVIDKKIDSRAQVRLSRWLHSAQHFRLVSCNVPAALSESSNGLTFIFAVFELSPFSAGFLSEKTCETLCILVYEERESRNKGGKSFPGIPFEVIHVILVWELTTILHGVVVKN